jgi:peptide chain release factor 1
VYSTLRFEGGVHRVQRVPATEAQGRVHTSTATVAVLPEAEEVDVHIDEKDLQITKAASGGPGGQGVNTTNSAVQVIHKPTGHDREVPGRALADQEPLARDEDPALAAARPRARRSRTRPSPPSAAGMVGSGERAEKIRTYNYPQNRVTDHRLQLTLYKLDRFMDGTLDEVLTPAAHPPPGRAPAPRAGHRDGPRPDARGRRRRLSESEPPR